MAVLSPSGAGTGEPGVIAGEGVVAVVVPATMPVRDVNRKGEARRVLGAAAAVGAATVVCLVYVGLPLLMSAKSVVRTPVAAVIVSTGVLLLAAGGVVRVLLVTGFNASQGPKRPPSGQQRHRPLDLSQQPLAGPATPRGARRQQQAVGQALVPRHRGTLQLRDIPDGVIKRLERLAARDGLSVGEVAVRELGEVSRRAENPLLLGSLPDLGISTAAIVGDLEAGRAGK